MNAHEERVKAMGCPECEGDITLYDTAPEGDRGRYKCNNCGRDTVWAVAKTTNILEVMKEFQRAIG
jgi:transposase-like protein